MDVSDEVLRVTGLHKRFVTRRNPLGRPVRHVDAVRGVSLDVRAGETVALVGESGSGKSTTGRLIARLETPDAGQITVCGTDWTHLRGGALRRRRRDLQMIFQDPYASLDPTKMIVHSVGEPLAVHEGIRGRDLDERVSRLLEQVGLSHRHLHRYPHEFSGGQRQRIAIARAIAADPRVVVADEAVSALDVSTQAQVLNLLQDLRRDRGLAFLFITHDLGVVRHIADRVVVMRHGRVVESGPADQILTAPADPYTRALLAAVPDITRFRDRAAAGPTRRDSSP